MVAATQNKLYTDVVQITQDFLGPAAQRFIDRQIKTHVNKEPEELSPDDMQKLAEWLKVAIALLTEDEATVNKYTESLRQLGMTYKELEEMGVMMPVLENHSRYIEPASLPLR